jgi:acetylornithine deacetylase/succinyl-diaminopimelate desuccinylase-like protein
MIPGRPFRIPQSAIRNALASVALLALAPSLVAAQAAVGEDLYAWVRGIEGRPPEGRRAWVREQLEGLGIPYETMAFDTVRARGSRVDTIRGENVIVRLGSGPRRVVVGAHLDAVPGAPGANDNGGGVAVLLGLARDLRDRAWNVTVELCFFDQEERGLVGARMYVARDTARARHLAMINFDVVGTGEEILVGPAEGRDDAFVLPHVRAAAQELGFPYAEHALYPGSDHGAFAAAGLENISISVLPRGDTRRLTAMLEGFQSGRLTAPPDTASPDYPVVLKVMHTPADSSALVTPAALAMAFALGRATLLRIDASQRP